MIGSGSGGGTVIPGVNQDRPVRGAGLPGRGNRVARGVPSNPAAARSFTLTFDSGSCLPTLRKILRAMLAGSDPDHIADAELVCTELVTNALDHADPPRATRIRVDRAEDLRIAVVDGSPQAAVTVGSSRHGAGRGLGMLIVDRIATHWHVTRNATTKAVRVALSPPAP
jgi:anti-sigma regulatory factor (Ser/Thr protein kinase)